MSATKEQVEEAKKLLIVSVAQKSTYWVGPAPISETIILSALESAERETAALRGLVRRMRDSGCSLAETIHGNEPCAKVFREAWDKACAEADKVVKP